MEKQSALMSDFLPFLQHAASGAPLPAEAMGEAMDLMLKGGVDEREIAGFLMALRARGETVSEIAAAAKAMRALAVPVSAPDDVIDTAGTGGDGADTFNISTAAAIVAAGAGAYVAKHGNKAATSRSGSSDVLASLGVKLNAAPETISACIKNAKVGFMFAAYHHGAVANVAPVRKALGVRTIFNLLGPLTNPAGAKRQLIGVFDRALSNPLAQALQQLGAQRALIVHGSDGLDEITVTGKTFITSLDNGTIEEYSIDPADAGLPTYPPSALSGGSPKDNAKALMELLDGKPGAYRDITLMNAGAALMVAGRAKTIREGVIQAGQSIDSGNASTALTKLVDISNQS